MRPSPVDPAILEKDPLAMIIIEAGPKKNWKALQEKAKIRDNLKFSIRAMASVISWRLSYEDCQDDVILGLKQFVEQHPNLKSNPVMLTHYCALIGQLSTPEARTEIRSIFEHLVNNHKQSLRYPLFKECLYSLARSSTENCQRAIEFYNQHDAMKTEYSIGKLASSCIKHNMIAEALELYSTVKTEKLRHDDLKDMFEKLCEMPSAYSETMTWLKLLEDKNTVPDPSLRPVIENVLAKSGFTVDAATSVSSDGHCSKCKEKLKRLSSQEYHQLLKAVRSTVIIRDDAYLNTTPNEISEFDKFMQICEERDIKFDLVVDALNICNIHQAMIRDTKIKPKISERTLGEYKSRDIMLRSLTMALDSALTKFDRILIISRQHMKSWHQLKNYLSVNRSRISAFYTANDSKDDPYIIYAALKNDAFLMTNDFLRRELCYLGEDGELFTSWLDYRLIKVDKSYNLIIPESCVVKLNVNENFVHVPFKKTDSIDLRAEWLCATKIKS
ncbi:hypothetical protein HDE_02520 [Halotydeus destructor]|nr:hypothetical protein HDE_02520 [Halotydeus destructor]